MSRTAGRSPGARGRAARRRRYAGPAGLPRAARRPGRGRRSAVTSPSEYLPAPARRAWVERAGLALPRVQPSASAEEAVADVLGHAHLVERVPAAIGVDARAADQGVVAAFDGRVLVQRRLEVRAGGDVVADATAVLVQPDLLRVADEEAAVRVVLRFVLLDPGLHVGPGLDLQPAVDRAAQPLLLEPVVLPVLEDRDRAGDVGEVRRAHDAAGDHERRVRPLPAEDRVDLDRLARTARRPSGRTCRRTARSGAPPRRTAASWA